MKSRGQNYVCATVFAALTIIGCSLSSVRLRHKRRTQQQRVLEQAVQTWEDEGGAVVVEASEERDELAAGSL